MSRRKGRLKIDEANAKICADMENAFRCCKEIEMKEKERLQKKIEIYEKALKRIVEIDEDSLVRERAENNDHYKYAMALGAVQAVAEMALEDGSRP